MNRKTLIIISAFVSAAIVISLSIGLPLYYHYSSFFYPDVTIISYVLNPNVGEEWTLNVSIILGNPCVIVKPPVIEFSKKQDYTVFITIKARRIRGLCLAVLVERNYLFNLTFPQIGNWTVHFNDKTITVYVQEPCVC